MDTGGSNKTGWIEPDSESSPIVIAIFKLFVEYKNYTRVAMAINEKFENQLGFKLSPERVRTIISNDVYVGKAKLHGQIKAVIAIVSNDLFCLCKSIANEIAQQRKTHPRRIAYDLTEQASTVKEALYSRDLGLVHLSDCGHAAFDGTDRKSGDEVLECAKCGSKWRFNQKQLSTNKSTTSAPTRRRKIGNPVSQKTIHDYLNDQS